MRLLAGQVVQDKLIEPVLSGISFIYQYYLS